MSKFKPGDKVRIVQASGDWYWYANRIGGTFTIDKYDGTQVGSYFVQENPGGTVLEKDIELELEVKDNLTTLEAVLHLQSMLEYVGDTKIIITEQEMFVESLGKTFVCENVEVLEEVCKAVNYLSKQETT